MKRFIVLLIVLSVQVVSQASEKLVIHTKAAEELLNWFDGGSKAKDIPLLLAQPAHQLMEPLLKNNEPTALSFKEALHSWAKGDTTQPDIYLIRRAYCQRDTIRQLLKAIGKAEFAQQAYKRVGEYFPKDYHFPRSYDIFLSPVGWKWGDAMSFSYETIHGQYAPSKAGTPTILFNLTLVAEGYGETLNKRMETFSNVLTHELFHAAYADYRRSNPTPMLTDKVAQHAFEKIMNEGLAHYIADGAVIREKYPTSEKFKERERKVFSILADSARVIFDPKYSDEVRKKNINAGTYGSYWSKYICMSGLLMAYHVETKLGRQALCDCVVQGSIELVRKYHQLQLRDTNLPALPPEMVQRLGEKTVSTQ
jgi:hypothetical protein